jgi:hypothetical protein
MKVMFANVIYTSETTCEPTDSRPENLKTYEAYDAVEIGGRPTNLFKQID